MFWLFAIRRGILLRSLGQSQARLNLVTIRNLGLFKLLSGFLLLLLNLQNVLANLEAELWLEFVVNDGLKNDGADVFNPRVC